MHRFAPEFAHLWLGSQPAGRERAEQDTSADEAKEQEKALEALGDRVAAARSIV